MRSAAADRTDRERGGNPEIHVGLGESNLSDITPSSVRLAVQHDRLASTSVAAELIPQTAGSGSTLSFPTSPSDSRKTRPTAALVRSVWKATA